MMWLLLLLLHVPGTEPAAEDVNKLILRNGDTLCEGHVEVYHNKQWGLVGDKYWSKEAEEVVCRSTHCGEPVGSEDVMRPKGLKVWLNELKCNGSEKHLWECENPGWDVSFYRKQTVKKIKCSNTIKLDLDGFKCAGVVRYSRDGKNPGHFCGDYWGLAEYNLLCESLGCSKAKEFSNLDWMVEDVHRNSVKMNINCTGIDKMDNLWQCADSVLTSCRNPAVVICKDHERLQLSGNKSNVCSGQLQKEKEGKWISVTENKTNSEDVCRQMHCGVLRAWSNETLQVECTDKIEVVLMKGGKETQNQCYGDVYIKVNGSTTKPVCGSSWGEKEAEVVCRELGCGRAITHLKRSDGQKTALMDNVKCSGNEASMWHCQAKHKDTQCRSFAYVVCSGNVKWELKDGFGNCSGRLAVQHEEQWKRVSKEKWKKHQSDLVCKHLNCGEALESGKTFCKGSGPVVSINCSQTATDLSGCDISALEPRNQPGSNDEVELVDITCADHKVYFLKGNESCSGEVWEEHGSTTKSLSLSDVTWNQEFANIVCQRCGSVLSDKPEVIQKANCSSTDNSTCNNTMLPSYDSNTVLSVNCSGKFQISLTDGCRGHVSLCMGDMCGGVCGDTWTEDMSVALCKSKKCGDRVLKPFSQPSSKSIIVKSLHAINEVTDLSQYTYVKNMDNDKSCEQKPAYVVCSGSAKPRFKPSRDQCSGNVEVEYDSSWLPVCMDALSDIATQNVICRELNCGEATNKTLPFFGPVPNSGVIKTIQCNAADRTLSACAITFERTTCKLGGLQCSGWRKMALEVQDSCSGQVIVHSEGKRSDVSAEGWTKDEGQRLCQDMNCGRFKNFTQQAKNANTFWNGTFSCAGVNPKSIWDCEKKQTVPSTNKKLFVECQGEPKVKLSNRCHGFVTIDDDHVCESQWNMDYSHMVCQQQDCSNAISFDFKDKEKNKYHVRCDDYHYILGQCSRVKGPCNKVPDVMCIGSIKLNTTKYCGGEIKLFYGNEKINVCYEDLEVEMKDKLCRAFGCEGVESSVSSNKLLAGARDTFSYSLKCTSDHKDVKHCLKKEPCKKPEYNKIYCKGYVKEQGPVKPSEPISVTSVVIGVGLTLLILIVIAVFVRLYFVRKARKSRVLTRVMSEKEEEFESEYEDVLNKSNEMEDFGRGRFGSEGGSFRGHDARSTSSFPYDDIDIENESRPLAPREAAAAPSGGDNMHEDGVNYEVDDPRESYDDIEAPPDVAETRAEVHDVLEAAPGSRAQAGAPAPGPAPGEGDYLVPGQDG